MTIAQKQLNRKFMESINKFVDMSKAELMTTLRYALYDICTEIIYRTPVDTGRLRANWACGLNFRPQYEAEVSVDPVINLTLSLNHLKAGDIFYFYNNLVYAPIVEYGLYPDPVKRGSWVKNKNGKGGYWYKKSSGGYSKQAPQGMLRVSINDWSNAVNDAWYNAQAKKGWGK